MTPAPFAVLAPEQCDCTCRCGDDPRIKKGTVKPCQAWRDYEERVTRFALADQLRCELGLKDWLEGMHELRDRRLTMKAST
jgi:hypothetical protein